MAAVAVLLALVFAPAATATPPAAPTITEPATDGQFVHPADVHMEVAAPTNPDDDACTDWEIRSADLSQRVWHADCKTGALAVHLHLADGTFDAGPLNFGTQYVLRARFHNSGAEVGAWALRIFNTDPPSSPGGAIAWTPLQPGYVVDEVAGNLRLPVNIGFVPNPGIGPKAPLLYVTELYGSIKVVTRDGTVGTYASDLLNFDPSGAFPGSGELGLTGIVVDPATNDVFASLLHDDESTSTVDLYPRVIRMHSTDGGLTGGAPQLVKGFPEQQGASHQISNLSFGPDGKLYVHMGDGFDSTKGQDLTSYRGKILRMNLDGSAPPDNPKYDGAPITARDYVYAYGFRNPFGGAWRASNGAHYEVENGPSVDRLVRVDPGVNYGYNGTDASMAIGALYNWKPSYAPVNIAFIQQSTFGGSGFPDSQWDRAFVTESGPTYATGPQTRGKRIVEFDPDTETGEIGGHPHTLVEYTGIGKATAVGLAAGPDGLYFTELYRDQDYQSPTDAGARLLRIRYGPPSTPVPPEQGAGEVATSTFNLGGAVKRCRRKFKENNKARARCVRRAKRHARALRS